jgi:hypothetical protein
VPDSLEHRTLDPSVFATIGKILSPNEFDPLDWKFRVNLGNLGSYPSQLVTVIPVNVEVKVKESLVD